MSVAMIEPAAGTDEALAAQAAGGDRQAFAELYRRFEVPVWSLARRMIGDPDRARDLTQDIFSRALAALRTFDPSRRFSSWIFKIATNHVLSTLDREKRVRSIGDVDEQPDPEPRPEDTVSRREENVRIREALGTVPERYRIVLVLFFQQEMSYAEIAETLGISVNLTRVRLFRGLRRLREELTR